MLIRTSKELGNFPAPTAAHSLRRTLSLTHKLRQDTLVHHALTNMHIVTHTDTHILTLRHTQTQTVTRRHAGWVGIANGCPFFPKKVFSRLNRPLLQALPGEARERRGPLEKPGSFHFPGQGRDGHLPFGWAQNHPFLLCLPFLVTQRATSNVNYHQIAFS